MGKYITAISAAQIIADAYGQQSSDVLAWMGGERAEALHFDRDGFELMVARYARES